MANASIHESATYESSTAFKPRMFSAVCEAIPRNDLFAILYIVGCANGQLGRFIQSLQFSGWEGALSCAEINVIMLVACFAGISLISQKSAERALPRDVAVGLVFLILVGLPIIPLSWVGVTELLRILEKQARANI